MTGIAGAAWVNGEEVDASDARVSIFDSGFISGVSVFDTLACWHGGLFKLPQHRDRFQRSAHAAMIPLRERGESLDKLIIETTRRSGCREAYVQVIATRGMRPTPSMPSTGEPTLIVYAIPYVWIVPQEAVETGISVIVPSIRNTSPDVLDPKIKNFNRFHSYFAKSEADRAGAHDVVMVDPRGLLTESRGSNVFIVRDGSLFTPRTGILEGITRQTVFEIAGSMGLRAEERDLTPYDLHVADEAFLCTTAGGIIPIVQADGRQIGAGAPGAVTAQVKTAYWQMHESGVHVTPVF